MNPSQPLERVNTVDSRSALLRLLGLQDWGTFVESIWERSTRIARDVVASSVGDVLTQDEFEVLAASAASGRAPGISIVEGRVARPVAGDDGDPNRLALIVGAYHRGCTLLQSGLQLRWPPIAAICRKIENELISQRILLAEAVGANAYLTPAASQGFDIHYDNHCAIILQLHGKKHWSVFSPKEELPLARCERAISRDQLGAPILETELMAGDVLYIPRGFPHCAASGNSSSLHLTLSLRTLTWSEVINASCLANTAFRQSIRLASEPGLPVQEQFKRDFVPRLVGIEVEGFLESKLLESLTRLRPIPNVRLRAIDEIVKVNADTHVFRLPLVVCTASEEADQAVLRFPGGALRLPTAMKPVFDFVARNKEFTPNALPIIEATYDAVELTRILIKSGVVCLR